MNNYAQLSVTGNYRTENQDKTGVFLSEDVGLFVLCDGMGGHYGGALASNITVNTFNQRFHNTLPLAENNINSYVAWFKTTVEIAKQEMTKLGENDEAKLDMGTTVTAAIFSNKEKFLYIFNIGDSRTYVIKKEGDLEQITVDHNLLNRLIREEGFSELKAKKVHYFTALTSALGPQKKTKIEVFDLSYEFDNISGLLATSDGVHGFIDKPSMEMILKKNIEPQEKVELLVNNALENNSTDNASAIFIELNKNSEWSE